MQGAFAASAGVTSGYLGVRNLSGPQEFIEGRFGLFRLYEEGNIKVITQDLGTHFESESISYKLYPSCQCNHAAIEGMLQLKREFGLNPDEIKSVQVFVSEYMQRLVGATFQPGSNPQVAAQFSIQYSIAALLLFGCLGVKEIQDDAILNPRIEDLVSRIIVTVDIENHNNYAPVRLKVSKEDGSVIERQVMSYRGNTDMPLSDSEMREKLEMCIEGCGKPVKSSQINSLFDAIMNIEEYPDMASAIPQILEPISH
jgi:2-methylcitrate dehydratase PrpD